MLRLFMSADVAGSTAYKAQADAAHAAEPPWLAVFRSFFTNFPIMLMGQTAAEMVDEESLPEIAVWKALGDELILSCPVQSAEEATLLVRALYITMANYEAHYLQEVPLRLKATAWVAEFPTPNIEIEIPELTGGGPLVDFIGPSIDLGFRISKFSRPSTVVLSLDLVELLLSSSKSDLVAFSILGREALKGVMFGRPYPIIWGRPSESAYNFMPWEVEDCPLTRRALSEPPASRPALTALIEDTRLYLHKMHGVAPRPFLAALGD
ncbi:MAG: hypothetical protein JWO51_4021 [Rhodospirillales bacterium]|nr:hypothetical protein [Rhodospirillales bacterium]